MKQTFKVLQNACQLLTKKEIFWLVVLYIGYLALDNFFIFERFRFIGGITQGKLAFQEHFRQFIFIFEYFLAFLIFIFCIKLKKIYSIFLLTLFFILLYIETSFFNVSGRVINLLDIAVLKDLVGATDLAVAQYKWEIFISFVSVIILYFMALYLTITNKNPLNFIFFIIPFVILMAFYGIILKQRGETSVFGFPKGFATGFGILALNANQALNAYNNTAVLEVQKNMPIRAKKIVFIVDESINVHEFSKLYKNDEPQTINFGNSYSSANCSIASNYILRKGTWIREKNKDSLDIQRIKPLFELAKEQNYRTVFIDNQSIFTDVGVRNYIDDKEKKYIDEIHAQNTPSYMRDIFSLKTIASELKSQSVFIFVQKIGAHFPYHGMIAPEAAKEDKIENYKQALQSNSIDFLTELTALLDEDTLVLYTSDHGQNLVGRTTHCSVGEGTEKIEYEVPILAITKNSLLQRDLNANKAFYQNQATHLEFSETARNVMGYSIEGIGSFLKTPSNNNLLSFCGLYGPPEKFFGTNARCKPIK